MPLTIRTNRRTGGKTRVSRKASRIAKKGARKRKGRKLSGATRAKISRAVKKSRRTGRTKTGRRVGKTSSGRSMKTLRPTRGR